MIHHYTVRYAVHGRLWPLVIVCVASLGCGGSGSSSYVQGKVVYEGKPVAAGTGVFFEQPGKGYIASAAVAEDGTYQLQHKRSEAIRPGEYVVYVGPPVTYMTEQEFRRLKKKVAAEYRSRGEKPPRSPDWVLPEIYYQSATSPLRATLNPGDNVIDLTLED